MQLFNQHVRYQDARLSTIAVAIGCALAAFLAAGCDRSGGAGKEKTSDGRVLVACTTTMIADLAHQIGGDRVRVVGIMPPKTDPHIYEPTPSDSVLFRKADLVLYNGLHLEGKMLHIIENAGSKAVPLAEDRRITPRESIAAKGAPDPHCWWDARHFIVYADRARDALIQVDPRGEADYRKRADDYIGALAQADSEVRAAIEKIPPERRYLITSHDAFYYYGSAYGLKVDAVLGISTDASATAMRINELAALAVKHHVSAVFHETSVSASLNDMITRVVELANSRGHPLRVAAEPLYSDSLGDPAGPAATYIGTLRENTRIIAGALSGANPSPNEAGSSAASKPAVAGSGVAGGAP